MLFLWMRESRNSQAINHPKLTLLIKRKRKLKVNLCLKIRTRLYSSHIDSYSVIVIQTWRSKMTKSNNIKYAFRNCWWHLMRSLLNRIHLRYFYFTTQLTTIFKCYLKRCRNRINKTRKRPHLSQPQYQTKISTIQIKVVYGCMSIIIVSNTVSKKF